jgi:hypothetical protein
MSPAHFRSALTLHTKHPDQAQGLMKSGFCVSVISQHFCLQAANHGIYIEEFLARDER